MSNRENFSIGLDRRDPGFQIWRIGGLNLRLGPEQVKQVLKRASELLPEQERHAGGGRIYVPPLPGVTS